MKLETFFEKFDQFAEAPNAVAKMRELVLQLAVQGKLVEQSPDDGIATDYIERSINESNRLVKEKRIRNSQSITPVSEFKTAGSLPNSWAWTTLAEISLINPRNDVEDDALATFIPMPGIPQNYRGPLGGEIRRWGEIKKSFTHFADGDIALAKITPCFQNGKSAVFRGLKNGIGAGTTELHVARPVGQPVLPEFVWIFLKSPLFIAEGIPAMTGSAGQKRVPTGYFALKPFPLPPFAEQKRIVAKVDELMALCDHLETQQKERDTRHAVLARASLARFSDAPTPANLNLLFRPSYAIAPADLRKTILTLAVEGNLVQSARTTRFDWKSETVGTVCLQITDGEHATPQRTTQGVPLATAKNIRDGYLDMRSTDWVAKETAEKCWKRCKPRHEDLLMVCVGATTGRICRAQHPPDMVLVRSVALIRPNPEIVLPIYMDLFLRSPAGQSQIWANVKQSAQPCLYLGKMSEIQISFPPLAEQRRIVAKVDRLMALVDRLETQIAAARAAAVNLMEAVVAELTAQE